MTVLPNALIALARVYIREGRFGDAEVALTEASELRRATGAPGIPDISAEEKVFLQCWRGDEAQALAQAAALTAARKPPSPGSDLAAASLALLDLSKGRYRDAFERLAPITGEDRQRGSGDGPDRRADSAHRAGRGVRVPSVPPSGNGCVECDASGGWWVHLRRCAQCGHVGCCDTSPSQHATAHWKATGHPIVQSFEPGEDWFWNYQTEEAFDGPRLAPPAHHPSAQPVPGPAGRVPRDWRFHIR